MIIFLLFFGLLAVTKFGTDGYCIIAKKFGFLDKPDGIRKLQKNPTPVGGGVAIYLVLFLALIGAFVWKTSLFPASALTFPLLGASLILIVMGLYDDVVGMTEKKRFLMQILLSTFILIYAKKYTDVSFFGYSMALGHLFYPLAVLCLLGFINSFNFLDGADGVVTTLGIFISVAIGAIAFINHETNVVSSAFVLTATLCGFFLCNMPPAKVYLGDAGSTLIGFWVGVLALRACATENSIQVLPVICVSLIPILDIFSAVIRRLNSGRGLCATDRAHFHHRVQRRFGRGFPLLGILTAMQIPLSIAATFGVYYHNDWIPLTTIVIFCLFIVATDIFGRLELKIVLNYCYYRCIKHFDRPRYELRGETYHRLGNIPWTQLWDKLVERTRQSSCVSLQLVVNMPFVNEDYHGEWNEKENLSDRFIKMEFPLVVDGRLVGKLALKIDVQSVSIREGIEFAEDLLAYSRQFVDNRLKTLDSLSAKP